MSYHILCNGICIKRQTNTPKWIVFVINNKLVPKTKVPQKVINKFALTRFFRARAISFLNLNI